MKLSISNKVIKVVITLEDLLTCQHEKVATDISCCDVAYNRPLEYHRRQETGKLHPL